jgi:uncharacterized protein
MTSQPNLTGIDHLPQQKQRELTWIVRTLLEELARKTRRATQPHRRDGRILKIILFGSYARGEQVEDPKGGYFSDFDLLVVVSHADFTDMASWWGRAEDRIIAIRSIRTTVNLIFHTMDEINTALGEGRYFFIDIVREGIPIYEVEEKTPSGRRKHRFAAPKPLDAKQAYELAMEYHEHWIENARGSFTMAELGRGIRRGNETAFNLHQATERAYATILLTCTFYLPHEHNIKILRSWCEEIDARLIEAWPRGRKPYDRYFDLLRRAYVEARYSKHYRITHEELKWLTERVAALIDIADTICRERVVEMKERISDG